MTMGDTIGNTIGNTIDNTIGNSIGNSIGIKNMLKNVKFPDNIIFVKTVRGTPRTILNPPRHFLDHFKKVQNFDKSCS